MKRTTIKRQIYIYGVTLLLIIFSGCYKYTGVTGFLSNGIKYPSKFQTAEVGGPRWIGPALNLDQSTVPVVCSIDKIYTDDGRDAGFLQYPVETKYWIKEFTGKETSVEEISAEYIKITRPALDMDSTNGAIILYGEADTVKSPSGTYHIDVKVSGPGGTTILKDAMTLTLKASPGYSYKFQGIYGQISGFTTKFTNLGEGSKLTVYFHNSDSSLIDPHKFKGYDYQDPSPDIKDFGNWPAPNPLSFNMYDNRIEMELLYPAPVSGVKRVDLYNDDGSVSGGYMNFWFDMALFKEANWQLDIYLDW